MQTFDPNDFSRPNLTPEEQAEKAAKHKFKQIVQPIDEADVSSSEETADKLLKSFSWADGVSDEEEGFETYECEESEANECAESVIDYIAANVTSCDFNTTETGIEIALPIPLTVHTMLDERFNNRWTLESRCEQIDKVRDALESIVLHADASQKLNDALKKILPPAQASWEVVFVTIDDDDVVVGGGESTKGFTASLLIGKQHA